MHTGSLTVQLQAISLSRGIHAWLQTPHQGTVLATFERSCYLDLDGVIVALVQPDLLDGPLNLLVAPDGDFRFDQLAVRERVATSSARILIGDSAEVYTPRAEIWEPLLSRWDRAHLPAVRDNMQIVREILFSDTPDGSFAHYLRDVRRVVQRAQRALSLLNDAMVRRSVEILTEAAGALAGLGSGLTPSGDDVLVGTLVALAVYPEDSRQGFRQAILGAARGRTTRISEAYLAAATRGEAGAAWHRLVRALPGDDRSLIASSARRVIAFGETSGADMLAGFTLAISSLIS